MTISLPFRRGPAWLCALASLMLGACAPVACQPTSIVVAKKDERARLETPVGLRTTETGRVEEPTMVVVREYWVQAEDGARYRVSAQQYGAAVVGGRLDVCR